MPDPLAGGPSFDRGAADANAFLFQLAADARSHEPGSDPLLAEAAHRSDFSQGIRLTLGKIVTSLPYVNWYLVQLEDARPRKPGYHVMNDTGSQPIGVRGTSPLPPNSIVIVFEHPSSTYCGILGVLPQMMTDGSLVNPDWISQGSNTGFRKERYYWELLNTLKKQGGVQDYSANRPIDSLTTGEWGRFSDTGLGTFLDSFMQFQRVDEATGLFSFYLDQFARLAGHNLDVRSAGHEITARDDEGEFQYFHGDTPYPFEALGAFTKDEEVHREVDDQAVMFGEPYAKYEPKHDDQQAFYRYREWGGYFGQGRMREVVAPPKESGLQRYRDEDPLPGVFREQIGLNGRVVWQSAKGFEITKRVLIPAAKQIKLPEDRRGDSREDGYDHAQHKLSDPTTEGDLPHALNAAGTADRTAVYCNWHGLHPFAYRDKDFHLAEQSELTPFTALQAPLEFGQLDDGGWLERPEPKQLRIDERLGEVDYYENTSGISFPDDGGVLLYDGYGGEIRMVGGHIFIGCPGHIFFQPGKSIIGLAGDDICLRAQKSADLSAGRGDLRLFGRNNLQMLAHDGGVMIESRATRTTQSYDGKIGEDVESGGIVLKAGNSQVVSWAKDIYLRTGGSDGNVAAGEIVLDADKGQQPIRTLSSRFERFTQGQYLDYFGIDSVRAVNVYSETSALLDSSLAVNDSLLVQGQAAFGGNIAVAGGHVATELAEQTNYMVAPLQGQGLAAVQAALQNVQVVEQTATQSGDQVYQQHSTSFYEDQKAGNAVVQRQAGFSFRNEAQYGTENFKLPETRWQQMARSLGAGTTWEEEPLQYQSDQLLPFPGKVSWEEDSSLLTLRTAFFDWSTGLDTPRGDGGEYEEPAIESWNPQTPSSGYLTLIKE